MKSLMEQLEDQRILRNITAKQLDLHKTNINSFAAIFAQHPESKTKENLARFKSIKQSARRLQRDIDFMDRQIRKIEKKIRNVKA